MVFKNAVHAFPDANIFLHFAAFDGLSWTKLCAAESVVVHAPQPLLRELNKVKDTGNTKTIRNRASMVLRRLKELWRKPESERLIGTNVRIEFEAHNPLPQEHETLDFRIADDALVAAVLAFRRKNNSAKIALVTDDSGLGLMVKAGEWNIPVIERSEEYRIPSELDAEQKENVELRRRLAKLEQCLPDLSLQFASGCRQFRTVPLADASREIEAKMKTLLAQKPANPPSDIDRPRTGLEQFRHNAGIRTPPYGKRVEKFMIDAEAAIRHNAGLKSKMIRVELEVINEGSTPARDVLATMHFPNGLKPLSRKQANEMFHRVPEAPWDRGDGRLLPAGLMPSYSLAGLHPVPDATRLSIRETNSYEVDWHVLKLRQEHRSKIDPFLILFENELFSFEIEYSIVADNAPDVVNGKLNVVVERA